MMNPGGCSDSGGAGSRRYERRVSARLARSAGDEFER